MLLSPGEQMVIVKVVFSFVRCGVQVHFSSPRRMVVYSSCSCAGSANGKCRSFIYCLRYRGSSDRALKCKATVLTSLMLND